MRSCGILVVAVAAGCLNADLVECEDGRLCPRGTVCDLAHRGCVDADQLTSCEDAADFVDCDGIAGGRCFDGVCLPAGCGNTFVEPGELCDDGNTVSSDGCSADCNSSERCGDGFVDATRGEQCDDGNLRSHDGCTSACRIEDLVWSVRSSALPSGRDDAAVAYDPQRERLLVFGGSEFGISYFRETYEWDGAMWTDVSSVESPSPRNGAVIVYDTRRHVFVLFGGQDEFSQYNDTWEWDGASWRRARPVLAPLTRVNHSMAYDPLLGKTVLFGGYHVGELDDTWTWDGVAWTPIPTTVTPKSRRSARMVFDPVRGSVVLVGGFSQGTSFDDAFAFDGTAWQPVAVTGTKPPSYNYLGTAAFDVARGVLTVIVNTTVRTTWELGSSSWTSRPSAPAASSLVYSPALRRVLGWESGGSGSSVLHEWNGMTWAARPAPVRLPDRAFTAMANDPVRGRVVVFSGGTGAADTWEWDGRAWRSVTSPQPPGRSEHAMAYAGAKIVLFGGVNASNQDLADTWTFDGTTWVKPTLGTSPPAARDIAMAYDAERREVVMFGGGAGVNAVSSDTWIWNGTTWTKRPSPTVPPARRGTAMAFDPLRKRVVMFGGKAGNGVDLGDTWEWDGTTWTRIAPTVAPEPRSDHVMVYNVARRRVMIFAGSATSFSPWEWDGVRWTQPTALGLPGARGGVAAAFDTARDNIVVVGGVDAFGFPRDSAILGYVGPFEESCASGSDLDGDGMRGCADSDCEGMCAGCGDGACGPLETSRTCPADCPSTQRELCGDAYCAPGETCPADCP